MNPQDIVSDEDIEMNHVGNFGTMSPRRVVDEGVLKTALGYHSGRTVRMILCAHQLIHSEDEDDSSLSTKGLRYLRALFAQKGIGATIDFLSHPKEELEGASR